MRDLDLSSHEIYQYLHESDVRCNGGAYLGTGKIAPAAEVQFWKTFWSGNDGTGQRAFSG